MLLLLGSLTLGPEWRGTRQTLRVRMRVGMWCLLERSLERQMKNLLRVIFFGHAHGMPKVLGPGSNPVTRLDP